MKSVEESIVEVACVTSAETAALIMTFLESEGLKCALRNEFQNQIFGGLAGGIAVTIELNENDAPRAVELLTNGGYEEYITYEKK